MQQKFVVPSKEYFITCDDVLRVAQTEQPETPSRFYIEVKGKKFPVTQIVRLANGAPHAWPCNSREILKKLGFKVEPE
jgi:hypothetical protein